MSVFGKTPSWQQFFAFVQWFQVFCLWFLRFLCFWCSFCGSKCFFIVFNGFLVVLCVFCIFCVLSVFLSFLKVCEGSLGFLCVSSIFPNFLSKSYVFSAFLTCACLPGLAVVASSVQQFMGKGSQPPLRQTSAKPNLKAMASRATKSNIPPASFSSPWFTQTPKVGLI